MLRTPFLIQRFRELDASIQKAKSWGSTDAELDAVLGDYLAVFACGVFEECVEHVVELRAARAQDIELLAFVKSYTGSTFRNPLDENIAGLLGRFGAAYKEQYRRSIKARSRSASALDSIVNTKNHVAHGTAVKHLTVSQVEQYRKDAELVFETLELILS